METRKDLYGVWELIFEAGNKKVWFCYEQNLALVEVEGKNDVIYVEPSLSVMNKLTNN